MNVLHLLRALRVGGLERVVVDLVNGLPSQGLTCGVGCLIEPGEWMSRVRPCAQWTGDLERCGMWRTLWSLRRFVRAHRFDLIHSHNSQAHVYGVLASLLTGVPLVHTKHGQNWPDDPRWVWKSRQLSRFSRCIVAVSEDIRRIVVDVEKVPAAKVRLIRNGIATDSGLRTPDSARATLRKQLGIPADAFVVGSVGRLAWEKNYELLVAAFAALPDPQAARLVLVGEGPYRERIERAARERGLRERCLLAGQQDDVPAWLAVMDVFCLSSLTEGASITLLEACAAGLPSVVTRVGGNAEIVRDGECGLVVPSADEAALSRAIARLRGDPALRARMGAAARERVAREYSVARMVGEYLETYRHALGKDA